MGNWFQIIFRDIAVLHEYEIFRQKKRKPMPRFVVNPGTSQAWEIQLKPGLNFLGRGASNDFKFDDPSVSGAHCQVIVDGQSATIRDMGSTNGTFVNRAKVQESRLANTQPVRLGSVDMVFYGDGAAESRPVPVAVALPAPSAPLPPPPAPPALKVSAVPISIPPQPPAPVLKVSDAPPAPAPALRISGLAYAPAAAPVATAAAPPTATAAQLTVAAIDAGAKFCKFHPKSPARYLCNKCNRTFCELCVTTLNVGGKTRINCRGCGVECVPLQVHLGAADAPKNFFASVPGAFVYPFRGSGIFILVVGMIIFAGIRLGNVMMATGNIRGVGMGLIMQITLGGYLFTFLQNIIHSTAAGDNEVPDLPGINFLEDILLPFFRLLGLVLVCFAPAVALVIIALVSASPTAAIGIFPAMLLGCVYFPMAFLAVAVLDSVGAVNPLIIIPSILKVPLEYLVTVVILAGVLIFTKVGDILVAAAFPKGMMTNSIPELIAMFAVKFIWSLIGLYLLAVNTRILGLLYLSKKDKLGWLGR
jgi:hypothetical protein